MGLAWWRRWQSMHLSVAPSAQKLTFRDVVDVNGFTMHMVQITSPNTSAAATPLVLTHGYASGAGIYYAAAGPLADSWPGPVYILDSPGCGLSDRPPWRKASAASCSVEEAESFYVERLESWRGAMGMLSTWSPRTWRAWLAKCTGGGRMGEVASAGVLDSSVEAVFSWRGEGNV